MQQNENKENLRALYSHISRMFNSSVSVLTAIIFGWVAFIGLSLNLLTNQYLTKQIPLIGKYMVITSFQIIVTIAALIFWAMAFFFFYFRILQYSRWIAQIENDLGLRPYCNALPMFRLVRTISIRQRPEEWTRGEIIAAIALAIYFIVPPLVLFLFSL